MKVSTKGRYALRMMVDLAVYDCGEYISLRDVAHRQDVSMKYMEQIVSLLTKSGFLVSVRGPQGGYRLSRRPEEYTVGDILRVTEGDLMPVSCAASGNAHCARVEYCPTMPVWEGLYKTITEYVDGITLDMLIDDESQRRMRQVAVGG